MYLCRECVGDDDHFFVDHFVGEKAICAKCKKKKSVVNCMCRRYGRGTEDTTAGSHGNYI